MKKKISIIGVGYVGLPLALRLQRQNKVIAFDNNEKRIQELKLGYDIFNDQSKVKILKSKNIKFSNDVNDINNSDFFIITVPTPVNVDKKPDLRALISATKIVGKNLKKNSIVIYESTVYPGCTEEVCIPLLEQISKLKINRGFFCGYSPERINVGDNLHKLEHINKIVSGSNKFALKKIYNLYSSIIKAKIHKAENIKVAEAAKVIENTQRDLNIALINEFSIIFSKLDIKTDEVLNAAATKWNFIKYQPGLVGGHCVGVDPFYLTYKAKQIGYIPKVILSGRNINDKMSDYVFKTILKNSKKIKINIKKSNVLIMGYSFKENCSDIRNSKVYDLVNYFLKEKIKVNIYDPLVNIDHLSKIHKKIYLKSLKNKKKYFDVLILAVPHRTFIKNFSKIFNSIIKKRHYIFDIKSALPKNRYFQDTL